MNRKVNEYVLPEPIICKGENVSSSIRQAFTTREVSELLSIPVQELEAMRQDQTGPKFYELINGQAGLALYMASDLTEWLRMQDGKCAPEKDKSDEL
jgi:hypothetical protein